MIRIFDTSSLLLADENFLFNTNDYNVITSITLKELEKIKTSTDKDAHIKYAARQLLRTLDEYEDRYECYIYRSNMLKWLDKYDLEINNDTKILAAAYNYITQIPTEDFVFYTNDMSLKKIAKIFFGKNIQSIKIENDDYSGFKEYFLDEEEMSNFYSNPLSYGKELRINQYVNIYRKDSQERIDTVCWTGEEFRPLKYKTFSSK